MKLPRKLFSSSTVFLNVSHAKEPKFWIFLCFCYYVILTHFILKQLFWGQCSRKMVNRQALLSLLFNKNSIFKVFNIIIWYTYTLWNDYYGPAIYWYPSFHIVITFCVWWENLKSIVLANFQYLLIIYSHLIMIYIRSLFLLILYHCNFVPFEQHLLISPTSLPVVTAILLSASMYLTFLDSH